MNPKHVKVEQIKRRGDKIEFAVYYDEPEFAGYRFGKIRINANQRLEWLKSRGRDPRDKPPTIEDVAHERACDLIRNAMQSPNLGRKLALFRAREEIQADADQ